MSERYVIRNDDPAKMTGQELQIELAELRHYLAIVRNKLLKKPAAITSMDDANFYQACINWRKRLESRESALLGTTERQDRMQLDQDLPRIVNQLEENIAYLMRNLAQVQAHLRLEPVT